MRTARYTLTLGVRQSCRRALNRTTVRNVAIGFGAIAIAFTATGCTRESPSLVATVGAQRVTEQELKHWTALVAAAHSPDAPLVGAEQRALTLLITASWLRAWAWATKIGDVQASAAHQLALFEYSRLRHLPTLPFPWIERLEPLLESPRATAADRRWLMALSVQAGRWQRAQLSAAASAVSRSTAQRIYTQRPARYYQAETRDIAIVESPSRAAMVQARREFDAGVSAGSIAKRLSRDFVYPSGLKRGYTRQLGAPALARAIFAAPLHKVVGPLQVNWYYVFEVLAIHRARRIAFDRVSAEIKREVGSGALRHGLIVDFGRAWAARTRCSSHVDGCRRAVRAARGGLS